MSSLFSRRRRTTLSQQPQGTEMQEYPQHTRPQNVGEKGSIHFPAADTSYTKEANAMNIGTIQSETPGLGSRMMDMVATEAQQQGLGKVTTSLTAPSAHNFYLKMGLHPSAAGKQALDNRFGRVNPVSSQNGRLNQTDLQAFEVRLKTAKTNPTWEGDAATVRERSGRRR